VVIGVIYYFGKWWRRAWIFAKGWRTRHEIFSNSWL